MEHLIQEMYLFIVIAEKKESSKIEIVFHKYHGTHPYDYTRDWLIIEWVAEWINN